jgi:16S rRNA (guanine527-N7)-methyltransferase
MTLAAQLAAGITTLDLDLAPEVQSQLLDYLTLLQKWNHVYNLTAVRAIEDMLTHHLLDSLAVIPHLHGETWVDVGSGAGLPGIPVALANRLWKVTLVESSHKKASFLQQAVIELDLGNVSIACTRVEDWRPERQFDVVVSRALSDLQEFVGLAGRLCKPNGMLAAMKGVYPHEELAHLPSSYRVRDVRALEVPGLGAKRHLVLIEPL